MAIEVKDVLGWLITGGLGGTSLVLTLLTRREARQKAKREAEAIWSLDPAPGRASAAQDLLFALKVRDPDRNRYRLIDVRVVEPAGARLAHAAQMRSGTRVDVNAGLVPGNYAEALAFERDLRPPLRLEAEGRSSGSTQAGTIRFFADWPSAIARKNLSRLVVVVRVEEISPSRRESRLTVRSQEIEWPIKTTPMTT